MYALPASVQSEVTHLFIELSSPEISAVASVGYEAATKTCPYCATLGHEGETCTGCHYPL